MRSYSLDSPSKDYVGRGSYVSDLPTVPLYENWRSLVEFTLIKDLTELEAIRDRYMTLPEDKRVISVDTETTSLATFYCTLVGFSFCFETKKSYYVPLNHQFGVNVEDVSLNVLYSMIYASSRVLFFNYRFDMRVLRRYGFDPSKVKHFDVQCLIWNQDTNCVLPSLKESALKFLGIKMVEFCELFGLVKTKKVSADISVLLPEKVYEYAATDAWCTLLLYLRFKSAYDSNSFIVDLDNAVERAIMFLEEVPITVDLAFAKSYYQKLLVELENLKGKVYGLLGVNFDLNSVEQTIQAMLRVGVPLDVETIKGRLSTSKKAMGRLIGKYPVVDAILEYRSVQKALSTYVQPFLDNNKDHVHFHYLTRVTPTGRLASGKDDASQGYFLPMNVQSLVKPRSSRYTVKEATSASDNSILGYEFLPSDGGNCEGFEPDSLRNIISASDGRYIISIDYDSEELVIAANMSQDPAFLDPLLKGEDIHKDTAYKMFGKANYNKDYRKVAKTLNFACLYGGNAYSLKQTLPEKTMAECDEFYNLWKKLHRGFFSFCEQSYAFARKNGYIATAFGRKRRVSSWYKSSSWRDVGFANRTVINSPVQGTGGDITRLGLCRFYNEFMYNPKYKDKVSFVASVHDESVFSVTREEPYFTDISCRIMEIMTDLPLKWKKPLTVSIAVGRSWGNLFPFQYKDGKWCPVVS